MEKLISWATAASANSMWNLGLRVLTATADSSMKAPVALSALAARRVVR
jgi:hypothetical protein